MDNDERINALFDRLDKWRHLPAYQLERRADIFFSLYLKGVLEQELGVELKDEIIPEFPILKLAKEPESQTNQSFKVDYVLFAKNERVVYFVELKTEMKSLNEGQGAYLDQASKAGFAKILEGLRQINEATKEGEKYRHLLAALTRASFPVDKTADAEVTIKVVYVLPTKVESPNFTCVDFTQFEAYVRRFHDPLSTRFADSLYQWRKTKAGVVPANP